MQPPQTTADGYTTALTLDGVTLDDQNVTTSSAMIEASNNGTVTLKDVTVQNSVTTASAGTAAGAVEWLKRMDKSNWESTYSDYNNYTRLVTDAKLAYYLALRYQLKGSTAAATAAVTVLISASVDGTAVLLEEDDATLESLILEGD